MSISRSGQSPPRTEDVHLLHGDSTFVANLVLPNAVVAHYVTSTVAHARLISVDATAAASAPGVLAVLTAADLAAAGVGPTLPGLPAEFPAETARPVLAADRVRFVGEAIVAIVAETAAQAQDAAELVAIEYELLDVVVDLATAHEARPVHTGVGSNVVATDALAGSNPIDFSGFEVVVEADIINNRVAPAPIETRVAAAQWDGDGRLVHHASCQGVHPIRNMLAAYYGLTNQQVRVTTADVGGSFGAKARLYPEEILLGHLSRLVGRPVRWIPSRSIDMVGLGHSRAQIQHVTIAGDRTGRIGALQAHVRVDAGAYPLAAMALALNTARMLPGPYDLAQVHWSVEAVVTNTTPIVAYRGAGRPESGALINRAVDLFAAEVGIDPVQIRRMNMITADQLPMTNPSGVVYDSGDYVEALEILVRELDLEPLRREQAERRAAGATKLLGVGVACFIDRTAGVPGTE